MPLSDHDVSGLALSCELGFSSFARATQVLGRIRTGKPLHEQSGVAAAAQGDSYYLELTVLAFGRIKQLEHRTQASQRHAQIVDRYCAWFG